MEKKEFKINISMPNLVNICVDKKEDGEISGRIFHCYTVQPIYFCNVIELLKEMEALYDHISFPQASTKSRSFKEKVFDGMVKKPEKVVSQAEIVQHRGKLGSFVAGVIMRQNSTWQGELFWLEKEVKQRFANTLDFIKMLDSALSTIV